MHAAFRGALVATPAHLLLRSVLTSAIRRLQRAAADYSAESLSLTAQILTLNPEFQSAWSFRRRILQHDLSNDMYVSSPTHTPASMPGTRAGSVMRTCTLKAEPRSDSAARQRRLEADLQLTNAALRLNPKNYSVWEHRKWVLHAMPAADWAAELALVDMYLQKDGRNCTASRPRARSIVADSDPLAYLLQFTRGTIAAIF